MNRKAKMALAAAAMSAAAVSGAWANRYQFHLARVIDSDTYRGTVTLWPGMALNVDIRVNGIDTPEKFRPNPKCKSHERAMALKATALARTELAKAERIMVTRPFPGKYAGRAVADVILVDGAGNETRIAEMLLAAGLAYEYHGGTKRSWCDVAMPP